MKKNRKNALSDYKFDAKWSRVMRIAHFLNWAAEHLPYDLIPHNEICRAISGYDRTPAHNSKEVESVRSSMSAVRTKLESDMFKRGLISEIGVGVRASVDATDVVKNCIPVRHDRIRRGKVALIRTSGLVGSADKITDPSWRNWFNTAITPLVAKINNPEFQKFLQPPPAADSPTDK